jgi:hypothetical protein
MRNRYYHTREDSTNEAELLGVLIIPQNETLDITGQISDD